MKTYSFIEEALTDTLRKGIRSGAKRGLNAGGWFGDKVLKIGGSVTGGYQGAKIGGVTGALAGAVSGSKKDEEGKRHIITGALKGTAIGGGIGAGVGGYGGYNIGRGISNSFGRLKDKAIKSLN